MSMQMWIVIGLVAVSSGYFVRDFIRGMANGTCASGCGSCASKRCALRNLQKSSEGLHPRAR